MSKLEKTFEIVRAMPKEQRERVINFVTSLQQKTFHRRFKTDETERLGKTMTSFKSEGDRKFRDAKWHESLKKRYFDQ